MSLPIRCFSCGKILKEHMYTQIQECTENDRTNKFNVFGITRYCCKRMLLTCIDTSQLLDQYNTIPETVTQKIECDNNRIFDAK